jgi:ASC-1-like (ASCH) protein
MVIVHLNLRLYYAFYRKEREGKYIVLCLKTKSDSKDVLKLSTK